MLVKDYDMKNVYEIAYFERKMINLVILLVPPSCFFLGGILIIGINASIGFEGWEQDKYTFIPAFIMFGIAIILFSIFFSLYLSQNTKICSPHRMFYDLNKNKLIVSPRGRKYDIIKLSDIEKIDSKFVRESNYFVKEILVITLKNNKKYKVPTLNINESYKRLAELKKELVNAGVEDIYTLFDDENKYIY